MLGMLLALYEHRTFVQSVFWDVNAFDQWGVELGKELAKGTARELAGETRQNHDSSTTALLDLCLHHRVQNPDADS
jgi:glucose-6-phosphate isomerase